MDVSQAESSRQAQRDSTASAIVAAAYELMRHGATPSVSEAAEAAGVSRATAYRYFPTQGALLYAVVRQAMSAAPDRPIEAPATDVAARVSEVARSLSGDVRDHEHQFRALLWQMLANWLAGRRGDAIEELPRGGRIVPIEAAVQPIRGEYPDRDVTRLVQALSMVIGIEGWVVLRDVWDLDDEEAIAVVDTAVRWLIAGFSAGDGRTAATATSREQARRRRATTRGR